MILTKYPQMPSPNYTNEKIIPSGVIIHWTGASFKSALNWLTNKNSKVSAHFLVDTNGDTVQLVDTSYPAWHAGTSQLKGYPKWCNRYTIGLELVGPPSSLGLFNWPDEQISKAAELCRDLSECHDLEFITDHSTISPGRKIDVKKGEGIDKFPWNDFVKMTNIKNYDESNCDDKKNS